MKKDDPEAAGKRYVQPMTAVQIREAPGADHVGVMFTESARIYRLLKSNPAFDRIAEQLCSSISKRRALNVVRASLESDVVEEVRED